jgi:Lrp/AsnC family leucine-responsive transcriptional regulator
MNSTPQFEIDDLDRKILQMLRRDGRARNAELARECGVAPSTMLERVRRLEEQGVIQGYQAVIDLRCIGLTVHGFVMITLDRHNIQQIRQLEKDIETVPYVRACYHLTGRFDYMLHVAARDLNHLGELIKERIATIPGIGKLETFLVFSEIQTGGNWPLLGGEGG